MNDFFRITAHNLLISLDMQQDKILVDKVLKLTREMIIIADEGQAVAKDDGCRLLYGIIQDCAYKIRLSTEKELELHRRMASRAD